MHGFNSTQWVELQHNIFTWMKSIKTGTAWSSLFIRDIWQVQQNMWLSRNLVVHLIDKRELEQDNTCANNETKAEF